MTTTFRLIKLILPHKKSMALAVLLGVLTIGSGIGLMTTSAYLISAAALHPSVAALGVAVVGVRFFGLARGVFRYLERYVSHEVTFRLLSRLRVWFYQAVEPLAPARLQSHQSGDLLSRVVSDVETLQNFYLRVLAPPLVALVVGVSMWFFLGAFDPIFALLLLGFYIMAALGVPALAYLLSRKLGKDIIQVKAELNVQLVDGVQGMAELVAFGQETRQLVEIQQLSDRLLKLQRCMAWVSGLHNSLSNLIMNLTMWTMLLVAIPLVQDGKLDGIYLALLALAALSSFEVVLTLPVAFQQLGSSQEAARRLFEIVDSPNPVTTHSSSQPVPQNYGLEVKHLGFRYNPEEPEVLSDISFNLPQGKTLAIVGSSGAGKSTILSLLLRFWDYQEGEIRLGGHLLTEYSPEELARLIAVVSQTTHLFNTTIRENLLLARPDATQAELEEAARQAQIHNFIVSLPEGYNTRVGEQGLSLSGGERQRLSITRAILKNSPILVLDEATSNLDGTNERGVLEAVKQLMLNRTTIIITHQLAGLEYADEILHLENGRVGASNFADTKEKLVLL